MTWNYPDYRAMRDHNKVFTGLAGYSLGLEPLAFKPATCRARSRTLLWRFRFGKLF